MQIHLAKTLKYVLLTLGIIILVLYIIFRFFMNFTMSDQKLEKYFEGNPQQPSYGFYEAQGKTIHYACIGAEGRPVIIFIHGSPGTWDAFARYFKDTTLLNHFRMYSVDRIGYGKSDHEPESSIEMQALMIKPLLDMVPDSVPVILVTHSFGGPVGFRLAMDYPEKIDGMVALAGLADPEKERRVYWLQKPLRGKWIRWILPPDMDISNREIVPLKQELYEMGMMWEKIRAKTIIIQGDKDMLVNKAHADFLEKMMPGSPKIIRLPEENHFIPWTQQQLVVQSIMEVNDEIQ
ncbi:MAG: alpha/beta hydrolase [Bacteroidia bacterium]